MVRCYIEGVLKRETIMNSSTNDSQICTDWRNRPVNSSIYCQYDHLARPVEVGGLVMARGVDGPITCQIERLMADGLYVKTVSVKSRMSSLLPPSAIWNVTDAA